MQKSDRRDALEICEGLRRGIYRVQVRVPPLDVARLRETLSRRRHFVRVQTAEINAAKRLLRSEGLNQFSRCLTTEGGRAKVLGSEEVSSVSRMYLAHHHALWREAKVQIVALESALRTQRGAFKAALERLEQIPGVGPIVAATAVAVFSTVDRFPSAKHAASFPHRHRFVGRCSLSMIYVIDSSCAVGGSTQGARRDRSASPTAA